MARMKGGEVIAEYLVTERNLAINTQKSYRDMLILLLPYLAIKVDKRIDRLEKQLREVRAELIHVSRLSELGQMVAALAESVALEFKL